MKGLFRLFCSILVLATALAPGSPLADTYDTSTLVYITAAGKDEVQFLHDQRIDLVGRHGDVYKALLTDEQLRVLRDKGLRIEILYAEMERGPPALGGGLRVLRARDQLLHRVEVQHDQPAGGQPDGAPAPAAQRPPGHHAALQPRRHAGRRLRHHRHEGLQEPRRRRGRAEDPHLRQHPRGREGRPDGRLRRARHDPGGLRGAAPGPDREEARGRVRDVVHPDGEPLRQRAQHALQQPTTST